MRDSRCGCSQLRLPKVVRGLKDGMSEAGLECPREQRVDWSATFATILGDLGIRLGWPGVIRGTQRWWSGSWLGCPEAGAESKCMRWQSTGWEPKDTVGQPVVELESQVGLSAQLKRLCKVLRSLDGSRWCQDARMLNTQVSYWWVWEWGLRVWMSEDKGQRSKLGMTGLGRHGVLTEWWWFVFGQEVFQVANMEPRIHRARMVAEGQRLVGEGAWDEYWGQSLRLEA